MKYDIYYILLKTELFQFPWRSNVVSGPSFLQFFTEVELRSALLQPKKMKCEEEQGRK
jgi:hypothetical protein